MRLLTAIIGLLLVGLTPLAAAPVTVTDIAGREVTIDGPVRRIVLSDFRQIIGLSLIDPEIGGRVVGAGSKSRVGPELRAALEARFPGITGVPELAETSPSVSAEQVIALAPDLVILSDPAGPATAQLVDQLGHAGIPTVYVDFRINPFDNTLPSLRIAAAAMGSGAQAEAFIEFYRSHRDRITERTAMLTERPSVLMHLQATQVRQCCMSLSDVSLGRFITAAGGHNIGAEIIPGTFAQIAPEFVLAYQPDIYIATGGRQLEQDEGLITGPGVPPALARRSLVDLTRNTPLIRDLDAVANGRSYGMWHSIHNSPLNILALELMAQWFHPDLFGDLDPQQTLDEINARFLPFEFKGAIWTSLDGQP
ncbi:ABC transporter substrate-binding protein [Ruegeria sp.]|uniref:ABC transporter substrate-binding protein n=1 Tax=Ruegeria sp. TaxID=1879320 RepID=UPI002327FFC7|nr:ABC transporter substrate-binding protein [Ruegeria sp.]MDA7964897.1 ABC transporter substrate-binding protein [Ruegeria sp.]